MSCIVYLILFEKFIFIYNTLTLISNQSNRTIKTYPSLRTIFAYARSAFALKSERFVQSDLSLTI